jgi:hypothetical protein
MHQVMVTEVLSQVYPQTEIDEWQIEMAAIVRVDGIHATQVPEQVTSGHLSSDELNKATRTTKSQADADNGYFVVKRA